MSTPGILLIELPDGPGTHAADAALRVRAVRGAGRAARGVVIEAAAAADAAALRTAIAHAASAPASEVWIAGGYAAWRVAEPVLPRGCVRRWWPTEVPGSGEPADARAAAFALVPEGGDPTTAALDLAPVRTGRERAPVALWDGEFVLAAGALRGAEGERLLHAFATAAEARSGLDLVVLCDPDEALVAAARALGIGWRVHCAGEAPREAEHTWVATAEAVLLPLARPVPAGFVLRTLAAGTPVVIDPAATAAEPLAGWLAANGMPVARSAIAGLEAAITRDSRVREACDAGRRLAASHEPEALAARLAGSPGRDGGREREAA